MIGNRSTKIISLRLSPSLRNAFLAFAFLSPISAVCGCGSTLPAVVSGVVTLDGKPLDRGTVVFHPTISGATAASSIDASGKYAVRTGQGVGLQQGSYRVTVAALREAPPSDKLTKDTIANLSLIPLHYTDPAKSGLACEIGPGSRTFDIKLESK